MHKTSPLLWRSSVMSLGVVAGAFASWSPLFAAPTVDASTLTGKLLVGYQGWFGAPGDGNNSGIGWSHWSSSSTDVGPGLYVVDGWPATSEYPDLFSAPNVELLDASVGQLFSARTGSTVDVHFRWMAENGIDGAMLQRFVVDILDERYLDFRDTVTQNVMNSAAAYGRSWVLEYDITGMNSSNIYDTITHDWAHMVEDLNVLGSAGYQFHDGKPVVALWGFGFTDRNISADEANRVIDFFQSAYGGVYLIGGVPSYWRTLTGDSQTDPAWTNVYRRWDAISPWTVGRYSDEASLETFLRDVVAADIADCNARGVEYLPVMWPGFSAMNAGWSDTIIPRRGGNFLWEQVYGFQSRGARMAKIAMFDEVNESTAIFKVSDNHPVTDYWFDNAGYGESWYMQLAGAAGRTLKGELELTESIPIAAGVPTGACCQSSQVCDVMTPDACSDTGGDYGGDGSTCDRACGSGGCGVTLDRSRTPGQGWMFGSVLPVGIWLLRRRRCV